MAFGKFRSDQKLSCPVWACLNGAVKLSNTPLWCFPSNTRLSSEGLGLSFTSAPHFWLWTPWSSFDVHISLLPYGASCHSSRERSRWMSQGKCCSPEKDFTLCVLPWGAAPASLAGWDEFKLLVLHGSWASRTCVKYRMRLSGNNPREARGPLCLDYSPDLLSFAFFRHKMGQEGWKLHFALLFWLQEGKKFKKNPKQNKTPPKK